MTGGPQFQPLNGSNDGYDSGGMYHGTTTMITGGDTGLYPGQPPAEHDSYRGAYAAGAIPLAAGVYSHRSSDSQFEGDQVPLTAPTREIDDFSHSFHAALERIGEEEPDSADLADHPINRGGNVNGNMSSYGASQDVGESSMDDEPGRPLWQQNRRQSRNLMWM